MMVQREYKNKIHMNNLSYVLLMPILIDFVSVVVQQFGMMNSSSVTMGIYILSLIIIFIRVVRISSVHEIINDFLWLVLLYVPFLFNYFFFNETRDYIISQDMLIIYLFFFPVCIFSIRKIYKWDSFFEFLIFPGYLAIGIAVIILLCLDYQKYLVYMGFSYTLLPFICVFYRMARTRYFNFTTLRRIFYMVIFLIGIIVILIFGARATVGFVALYVMVYELIRADLKLQYKLISFIILAIISFVIWNEFDLIINCLSSIDIFENSYILKNVLSGRFFESSSRTVLYEACRNRIATIGFDVTGFFGDRMYCLGYAYPHNIIYEIVMSFGWLFGSAAVILYALLLIKCILLKNNFKREIVIFLIVTMFARFFISGSYLIEGKFWIVSTLFIGLGFRKRGGKKIGNRGTKGEIRSYII